MAFPPAFTNAWDETAPPDTQAANLLGQDLRNLKTDIRQRMALLSGTLVNRPTPDATFGGASYGVLYFATDTNQVFQWNGAAWTDISATFAPLQLTSVNLTGKSGSGTGLILNSANGGFYQIELYGICTASTGAGIDVSFAVTGWDDEVSVSRTITLLNAYNMIVGTNTASLSIAAPIGCIHVAAGSTMNWSLTITAHAGGTGTINLYIRVLKLS